MAYARANDYVVLTYDLDFSTILAVTRGQKPSVVQLRVRGCSLEKTAALILSALTRCETDVDKGAVLTIDNKKIRLCLLPIRTNSFS